MVVFAADLIRVSLFKAKRDPVLLVDANDPGAGAGPFERFESVANRESSRQGRLPLKKLVGPADRRRDLGFTEPAIAPAGAQGSAVG